MSFENWDEVPVGVPVWKDGLVRVKCSDGSMYGNHETNKAKDGWVNFGVPKTSAIFAGPYLELT